MQICIDTLKYNLYKPLTSKFSGATEVTIRRFARFLSAAGHRVDVVSSETEEAFAHGAYWWTPKAYPKKCDVLLCFDDLSRIGRFKYDRLFCYLTTVNPTLADNQKKVTAFVALSQMHRSMLLMENPQIEDDQVIVIYPGVDANHARVEKVPNRLIWCTSPDRGLIHIARQWPRIRKLVPTATIAVTYDVPAFIARNRGTHGLYGEWCLELERFLVMDGVLNLGGISKDTLLIQQALADLMPYPIDPGDTTGGAHAFAVLECAAAGCAILLPAFEAMPELYKEVAEFLAWPIVAEDWPHAIADILKDRAVLLETQKRNRKWAGKHRWNKHDGKWIKLLTETPVARQLQPT